MGRIQAACYWHTTAHPTAACLPAPGLAWAAASNWLCNPPPPPCLQRYYAINRHKATTLTPAYHAGAAMRGPRSFLFLDRAANSQCIARCARLRLTRSRLPAWPAPSAPLPCTTQPPVVQRATRPTTTVSTTASSCTTSGELPTIGFAFSETDGFGLGAALAWDDACRGSATASPIPARVAPLVLLHRWPWQFRAIDRLAAQAEAAQQRPASAKAVRLQREHDAAAAGTRDFALHT